MYCWMQELHEKNFTNAESSDSHEKNEKAQKTKKKAIFTIRGGFFSPVKKKKKFGVRNFPAMGRVGGVVVEIIGVCGVGQMAGGSFTAPNGPGRPPPSPKSYLMIGISHFPDQASGLGLECPLFSFYVLY